MFKKKVLMILFLGMILISMASASMINIGDYVTSVPQGECFNYPFACGNCSFVDMTFTYPNGTVILAGVSATTLDGFHYNYSFCNTSITGRYWISSLYDDSGENVTDQDWIYVTPNGINLKEGNAILYLGILSLIFVMLILSILATFKVENYIGKFTFYWISHLLLILFSFSVWQIANGFLIGFIGLAGIFKVMFYFSIIAVLPMMILSIVWIVYIHTMNEHFERLIKKGEDPETAFKMTEKKHGGWFYGKR